jgi:hypothetical protein
MKARTVFLLWPVLLLGLSLTACDKEPAFPTAPVSGTLEIVNNSAHAVNVVQFRAAGAGNDWSANMFSWCFVNGNSATLSVPPGTLDVYVESGDDEVFWIFTAVEVPAGGGNQVILR